MVKPERRTRGDIAAALAIVVVVAAVAAVIWWTSDARATISRPAPTPLATLPAAEQVPATLTQLWSAPSPASTAPVVAGGAVVTGDGQTVTGRDPLSGASAWSYSRDLELCGLTWVYNDAVAVYPDRRGCGQVSTIDGNTGRRGPARTSFSDPEVRLSSDGTTVLSAGDSRLELWRSDMVRMISYGALDARIKPDVPAGTLCALTSAAASSAAVSVLEACPDEPDLRLTLLRPSDDEDQPDIVHVPLAGIGDDSGAQVVAVAGTTTAVYLPSPAPRVDIVDETGETVASTALTAPVSDRATATRAGDLVTWWTGDSVLVFGTDGPEGLRYRYTVSPTGPNVPLGPATVLAGQLLVPVTAGYDVFDAQTGAGVRHIPLTRTGAVTPVVPAVAGAIVLEQRGPELVALG